MKGSHTVEVFINWLKEQDNFPIVTRLHLAKKIKFMADKASQLQKQTRLDIKRQGETVIKMRFFEDGSMEVGWPTDAKWYGTPKPQFIPPPEKEL